MKQELQSQTVDYLEGLLEGFVAYDESWVMTYMNAAAERLLGRRREEVLGKTWHQAFPHALGNPVDQMYQRVMRTRRPERMEYHYAHYGRWLEISASPVRSGGVGVYFRDISDRVESEQRFRTLADSAPVLIWVNGAEGCEYVNRNYLEFFGAGEVDVRGYDWTRFVHPEDREGYLQGYGAAMRERRQYEGDVRLRHHGGEWRWMRSIGIPRLSPEGRLLGDAGCAVDITAVKAAGDQLRDADRRKDEFLAMLAHELRNPLAPLRNGLHLLRVSPPGSEAAEQARAMMERQLGHLIRVVDDLLEVSRISSGKIELRRAPIELAAAVHSAVETSRPAIEAARHRLDISLPPAPVRLHGDLVRLAQVIANLLNNAAKYTDPGGRVALAVKRDGGEALISVRDNGVGISVELLPRVFDMFAQADRARAQGGLGIGLALARTLVEMHGGRIEARSDGLGQGSEFVVRLPVLSGSS